MKRFFACLTATLMTSGAWAVGSGGYTNQVVGAKALSMGNAFSAVADDATALFFNPAGLAGLAGQSISLGVGPTYSKTTYHSGTAAAESTNNDTALVPNAYYSQRLNEKMGIGVGLFSPFGLETHWSPNGQLRYVATDSRLHIGQLAAGVGYQATPWLSFGAAGLYTQVRARLQSQMNLTALNTSLNGGTPVPSADGKKTLEGDGGAFGYGAGVLVGKAETFRLGISYRSSVHNDVEGDTTFEDLNNQSQGLFGGTTYRTGTKTRIVLPDSLTIGVAGRPTPKLLLSADAELVGYHRVNETAFTFDETNSTRTFVLNSGNPINRSWGDTWNVGFGASYKLNDHIEPRLGFFHYQQAIPNATWDPSTPESKRDGITAGFGYMTGPVQLDFAYNLLLVRDRTINNDVGATSLSTVDGKYTSTGHVFGVNITYSW